MTKISNMGQPAPPQPRTVGGTKIAMPKSTKTKIANVGRERTQGFTMPETTQAKPIFVVRVPERYANDITDIKEMLQKELKEEYHILTVLTSKDDYVFESFNVINADPVEMAAMESRLNTKIEAEFK